MPKHVAHTYLDKLFFHKKYYRIHRAIDFPWLFLGAKHREVFHTPQEAFVIGVMASGELEGGMAGLLHVWADRACSQNPKLKKYLEFMAKYERKEAKKRRRWEKKMEQLRKKEEAKQRRVEARLRKRRKKLIDSLLKI
jgi:hypothetical protein